MVASPVLCRVGDGRCADAQLHRLLGDGWHADQIGRHARVVRRFRRRPRNAGEVLAGLSVHRLVLRTADDRWRHVDATALRLVVTPAAVVLTAARRWTPKLETLLKAIDLY